MGKLLTSYDAKKFETKIVNGKIGIWEKDKETAEQWAYRIYDEYNCDHFSLSSILVPFVYAFDNAGNIAKAKCSPSDKFSSIIGVAIAYARLKGLPIHPDFLSKKTKRNKKLEFKVGAIVEALPTTKSVYAITTNGWKGKIVKMLADSCIDDIEVQSLPGFPTGSFSVNSKYFKVIG